MKNNIRKQFVQIALLLALGTVTAAHAVSQPIQTERGVVRLGSKTQANVDAKQSSVAIGVGMVLVSSNPGRLGRPALKVSFNGAPMHAKVQGTALIAYLPEQFIQITGVEGRTYLVREGRLGENVAIDAGKMLLVKPTAKRLPDTVDINLSNFIENSPMFNERAQTGRFWSSSHGRLRSNPEIAISNPHRSISKAPDRRQSSLARTSSARDSVMRVSRLAVP